MPIISAHAEEVAYRSGDDAVLATFRAKTDERAEHKARLSRQLVAWGFPSDHRILKRPGGVIASRDYILGVAPVEGQEPPAGWRIDRETGAWVPKLTTRAGKRIKVDLAGIQPPSSVRHALPGMAGMAMSGNRIYGAAMFVLDDVMYLYWPVSPDEVDPTIWEKVKISDYYLAKEAYDEHERLAGAAAC